MLKGTLVPIVLRKGKSWIAPRQAYERRIATNEHAVWGGNSTNKHKRAKSEEAWQKTKKNVAIENNTAPSRKDHVSGEGKKRMTKGCTCKKMTKDAL